MTPTFPDDFNLADYFLFDRIREGRGERIALRFGDRTWTYTQVADRARALARFLVAGGLRPEQRVYLVLPDTPAFAWSIFGILAAGGVLGRPCASRARLAARSAVRSAPQASSASGVTSRPRKWSTKSASGANGWPASASV